MAWVKLLDVGRDLARPVCDDSGVAAAASWLVAELPGKDGGGVGIPGDNSLNIVLVCRLGFLVGVEGSCTAAECGGVGVYAAKVVPVVDEREHQLDAVLLSGGDDII